MTDWFQSMKRIGRRSTLSVFVLALVGLSVGSAAATLYVAATSNDEKDVPSRRVVESPSVATESPTPAASSSAPAESERYVVYLVDLSGDSYSKNGYKATAIPDPPEQSERGQLMYTIRQLVVGVPEKARSEGLGSVFDESTRGVLLDVHLAGRRAIVNFRDFTQIIPQAGTTQGGAVLLTQLNATIFQFPSVNEIEYRFEGSCDAFWKWQQAEYCQLVTREAWEAAGSVGSGVAYD